ncbi:unnamed protein product [Owenia fusiformis]|uniref:Uncharacterized protein n=1 Tax=Owenia fusiformis TaxID=6347 RepID=A0A8J1TCB0_OWEFU|nr:unnamed protein product [Owenia fusiformis]
MDIILGIFTLLHGLLVFISAEKVSKIRTASQCFKSRGIPRVQFSCPQDTMIKIHRAFHGIAVKDRKDLESSGKCKSTQPGISTNCTFCEGDCIDDSMNMVYDWSNCMGNTTCNKIVMQSYMSKCDTRKFSDYMQVEYECVKKNKVIDVCGGMEQWAQTAYIKSPKYPSHYPINKDCLCRINTAYGNKIKIEFKELLLETKEGSCIADWLMFKERGKKERHCGAVLQGTKTILSNSNSISLHFHSDENENKTQKFQYFTRDLKGFWLQISGDKTNTLQIHCRTLQPNDIEVIEVEKEKKLELARVKKAKEEKERMEALERKKEAEKEKLDEENKENDVEKITGDDDEKLEDESSAATKFQLTISLVVLTTVLQWLT